MCATMQDHLYVEMGMRFQDKEVSVFSFSRERGTENAEPHLNGHFDLNTTATDKPLVTKREHAALKAILERATNKPFRLMLKMIPPCNRTYGYGYDFKDLVSRVPNRTPECLRAGKSGCWLRVHTLSVVWRVLQGKPHFRNIKMGLAEEEVQQALDYYRSKAAQNAFSGCVLSTACFCLSFCRMTWACA